MFLCNKAYFNPKFLFWRGDDNPRHSLLPMGQLHYVKSGLDDVGAMARESKYYGCLEYFIKVFRKGIWLVSQ